MIKLRNLTLGLGTILMGLTMLAPVARADWGDALLGAAVGAGIHAAVDDDDDGRTYYRQGYRSFSPYGTRTYRTYRTYRTSPYRSYRSFRSGLPFGASYFVDQGEYRNYKDAYGNHLGRERIRW